MALCGSGIVDSKEAAKASVSSFTDPLDIPVV